jgi:tetratricopeptide (TPR) repeat protein
LTRAAIHLIEKGQARPSMPTLELIARRTGRPISFFVQDSSAGSPAEAQRLWAHVEAMLAREEFAELRATLEPVVRDSRDEGTLALAHFNLGISYAKMGDADPTLRHMREARPYFEKSGDRWRLVECLDWEALALSYKLDPGALSLAERALAECRKLNPLPIELEAQILGHIARIHVVTSNWTPAVEAYKAAVDAAGSLRDLGRLARMYDGLGLAYVEIGNPAEALACSQKAVQLHSMLRNERSALAAENNLGWLLLRQGRFSESEGHLESAYRRCKEQGFDYAEPAITLSLAELRVRQQRFEEARDWLDTATKLADDQAQPRRRAKAHQLEGEIAAHQCDDAAADSAFEAALSIYSSLEAGEELIACHAAYAQALEDRGDLARSVYHWKQAVGTGRPHLVRQDAGEEAIRLIS